MDSTWARDVRAHHAATTTEPALFGAGGRAAPATIDSGFLGMAGCQNEGDNEVTGLVMSNGDPSPRGILGAEVPKPFRGGWRLFFTQQHGDNVTWEILPNPTAQSLLSE